MKRTMVLLLMPMLMGGCSLLEGFAKPTAEIVGAQIQNLSLTSTTLLFDVDVSNPYSTALPLTDADYALESRGVEFLNGAAELQGAIPAHGSKVVQLPVTVDFMQLLRAVDGVELGSVVPYDADLGLSVESPWAGVLRLPLSRSGELTVPSREDLTLDEAIRYAREYLEATP